MPAPQRQAPETAQPAPSHVASEQVCEVSQNEPPSPNEAHSPERQSPLARQRLQMSPAPPEPLPLPSVPPAELLELALLVPVVPLPPVELAVAVAVEVDVELEVELLPDVAVEVVEAVVVVVVEEELPVVPSVPEAPVEAEALELLEPVPELLEVAVTLLRPELLLLATEVPRMVCPLPVEPPSSAVSGCTSSSQPTSGRARSRAGRRRDRDMDRIVVEPAGRGEARGRWLASAPHPSGSPPMQTMKAIRVHAFGGRDHLKLEELPAPTPGEGELLIRVRAAGVNPVDGKIVRGLLQGRLPHVLPFVPGWDFAGEVLARGHAARRFEVGDRVFGYLRRPTVQHGAWAEQVVMPESYAVRMAPRLSFAHAAAMPLAALTSLQTLRMLGLSRGQRVGILGASGGTGSFGLQIARNLGLEPVAIASPANHAYCLSLGAAAAVDYAQLEGGRLSGLAAGSLDGLYDCVSGTTLAASLHAVKEGGRVASILDRQVPPGLAFPQERWRYHFVEPDSRDLALLSDWAEAGRLTAHLHEEIPLAEAGRALAQLETGHTRGKVVLTLP